MVRPKEDSPDEPDEPDSDEGKKSKKIEIKPAQVAGAATASVTAAFLGSKLGVAGTVIGAGMTSVIITVGGALYQRSFENAKDKALLAAVKAKRSTRTNARELVTEARSAEAGEESTRLVSPEVTRKIRVESGMHWPGGEQVVDSEGTRKIDESTRLLAAEKAEAPVSPPVDRRKRRLRWAMAATSCAVAFVLSMLVVTGFEGITGRPLSGGESGTTLGQVLDREPRKEVAPPADEVEQPTQTPTREPVPTTEAPPTQQPTQQPQPEDPQPSQQPTQPPSTEQTPTQQPTRTQEPNEPAPPTERFQEPRLE